MQQQLGVDYDTIQLQLKKDQAEIKKGASNNLILNLRDAITPAFCLPKARKENFITQEMIMTNVFKVMLNQKRYQSSENVYDSVRYLAAFDTETNEIGKIYSINLMDQTISFFTYGDMVNGYGLRIKPFKDVLLFDYNSIQFDAVFRTYKTFNKAGLSLLEMQKFLSDKTFKNKAQMREELDLLSGYGTIVEDPEENVAFRQVKELYNIPDSMTKKQKKMLQKLDPLTMAVLEEFTSIKDAEQLTGIKANTISNVVCTGESAKNYLLAGKFRWQWSDKPNTKYSENNKTNANE